MKTSRIGFRSIVATLAVTLLGSTLLSLAASPAQALLPTPTWTPPVSVNPCNPRTNLPALCVTLASTVASQNTQSFLDADKNNSIPAAITVVDPSNPANNYTNVNNAAQTAAGEIHGRGNFTWNLAKKPYQIKFSDKVNLLGIDTTAAKASDLGGKKWVLLANQADPSFMRNAVAFTLGKAIGLNDSPEYSYVDLFINGAYRGNYMVTEKAEIGKGREPLKGDSGVLVELDNNYCSSEPFKAYVMGNCLVLKDAKGPGGVPDTYNAALPNGGLDPLVQAGWQGAIDRFNALNHLLMNPDGTTGAADWAQISSYIDVDSFVKFYWVQEVTENPEVVKSSINFWYDPAIDGKLHAGPIWDFDSSQMAYVTEHLGGDPTSIYVKNADQLRFDSAVGQLNQWYDRLARSVDFARAADALFSKSVYPALMNMPNVINGLTVKLGASAGQNFAMWSVLGTLSPMGYQRTYASTWQGEVGRVMSFVTQRTNFLRAISGDGTPVLQEAGHNNAWQLAVGSSGQFIGTTGKSLTLNAFRLNVNSPTYSGAVTGQVYYGGGWHAYTSGTNAGNFASWPQSGDGGNIIQAVQFNLTGSLGSTFTVQYRAHVSSLGWQPWTTAGGTAGTPGKNIEAIQIRLMYLQSPPWYQAYYAPFIKASYNDFLGRQPSAAEILLQSNGFWTGGTREGYLSSLANSTEWLSTIVTKMYQDTLNRAPDPAGLQFWVNILRNKTYTVAQVASMFYSSDEFFNNQNASVSDWVTALYNKLLGRSPDPAGLQHWIDETARLGRTAVAYQFYQTDESCAQRVTALYNKLLQRGVDPTGLAFWTVQVRNTGDITLAINLAASDEYWTKAQTRFPN